MIKLYPQQYEIWIADLNPSTCGKPEKIRPVIVIQSDVVNKAGHSSTITCSISSQHREGVSFLRIPIEPSAGNGLLKKSYILCDQVRAIDVQRLKEKIGIVSEDIIDKLNKTLKTILTL